jgi:hypothetical protein
MTEKTNKIKLPKYSSYLSDTDIDLLDLFCAIHHCSKAKALSLLLAFWSNNKGKVSNELASISSEDLSAKKYEERFATIEDKLANISYDTELATIKERLATLEDMLATIANNDIATISNELANDKELIGIEKTESNLVDNILTAVKQKEDITAEITLSESPILPLIEDSPVIVPDKEITALFDDIQGVDAEKDISVGSEVKLSEKQKKLLENMKAISKGTVFESQSKLGDYLGLSKSEKYQLTKLKSYWEKTLFAVTKINGGSNELTRL